MLKAAVPCSMLAVVPAPGALKAVKPSMAPSLSVCNHPLNKAITKAAMPNNGNTSSDFAKRCRTERTCLINYLRRQC
jgi:hypothetical protein